MLLAITPAAASALTWSYADDFRTGNAHENPSRDSYGNPGVWAYEQSSALTADQNTGLLPRDPSTYTTNGMEYSSQTTGNSGIEIWGGDGGDVFGNRLPANFKNASGADLTVNSGSGSVFMPAGTAYAHPFPDRLSVLRWTSPITGTISIASKFTHADTAGDGVDWSVDRGTTNLAHGALGVGENGSYDSSSPLTVAAGDTFYFTVGPGAAQDYNNDTTRLEITITGASALRSDPAQVDFGTVDTGKTSAERPLTINNDSAQPVDPAAINLDGPFNSSDAGSCLDPIPAGGACHMHVTYTPAATGPASGTVRFRAADQTLLLAVPLTGTGVAPGAPPDTKDPTITITSPQEGYTFTQGVGTTPNAEFSCADSDAGDSGILYCDGFDGERAVQSGYPLDVSTVGEHTFTVHAVDHAGNDRFLTVKWNVAEAPSQIFTRFGITTVAQAVKEFPKTETLGDLKQDIVAKLPIEVTTPSTVIAQASGVISSGGGNVISSGGGNVISSGGGNVISSGGGNLIGHAGGNVISSGGGNVISSGGGNVISSGGGNVISSGGGNRIVAPVAAKKKHKLALLATGGHTFDQPGSATIKVKLTKAGKRAVKAYRRTVKKRRRAHKKVKPMKIALTMVVGLPHGEPGPAVAIARVLTIKP